MLHEKKKHTSKTDAVGALSLEVMTEQEESLQATNYSAEELEDHNNPTEEPHIDAQLEPFRSDSDGAYFYVICRMSKLVELLQMTDAEAEERGVTAYRNHLAMTLVALHAAETSSVLASS